MKYSFIVDDNAHLISNIMQVLEIQSSDLVRVVDGSLTVDKDSITDDFIIAKIKGMGLEDLYDSMTQPSNEYSYNYCIRYIDKEVFSLSVNKKLDEYTYIDAEGKYTGLGSITTVIHKVVDQYKLIKGVPDNVDEQGLIFVKAEVDFINVKVVVSAKYSNETPRQIELLAYQTVKSLMGGISIMSAQYMTSSTKALKTYYIVV